MEHEHALLRTIDYEQYCKFTRMWIENDTWLAPKMDANLIQHLTEDKQEEAWCVLSGKPVTKKIG